MTNDYPIEALLRPPIEIWSALTAGMAGIIAIAAPWALMMPPVVAWISAAIFLWITFIRSRQAAKVLQYQRNICRMPTYIATARQIPTSHHKLFLGKGFRWTQKHTQRLRDAMRPDVSRYTEPSRLYYWARQKEVAWEHNALLRPATLFLRKNSWYNPCKPLPPIGGIAALHAVEPHESNVWMDLGERVGHTIVLGTTRVGKTRLAEILITQDIRRGDVTIAFDPKGDADLLKRMYVEAKRAKRPFIMFHLGHPELSARYNAVGSFGRITEVAGRIANQLPSEGNSAAFREFAWRFTNIVARAMVALGRRPDYAQITRYITNIEPLLIEYCTHWLSRLEPNWEADIVRRESQVNEKNLPLALKGRQHKAIAIVQYIKDNQLYDPIADGLRSAFEYDKTYFDKIVASLLPLLEKLISGKSAELLSPDYFDTNDKRPIFDWMTVIRQQAVVYIGLDALSDATVAAAVGNSMFADLTSIAGRLYKHGAEDGLPNLKSQSKVRIALHADEFNEIIGDEFIPMVNKAGGAGFQVTAYTQTWSDVEARVGSRAKADQVAGNFNNLIMLRVKNMVTAEMLTNQLPTVEVFSMTQVSGVNDSADPESPIAFTSTNQDRISVTEAPMIQPSDIIRLPKGQAFALIEGGHLWKIRMPLPDNADDHDIPSDLQIIANDMSKKYTTSENWWRERQPK